MPGDSIMSISASGMEFQHKRLEAIAHNIANANVTRARTGQVYRPLEVVAYSSVDTNAISQQDTGLPVELGEVNGVVRMELAERNVDSRKVYDPSHPDADAMGYVEYPGIDQVVEMTSLMSATRAYEANIKVMQAAKSMAMKALEMGD